MGLFKWKEKYEEDNVGAIYDPKNKYQVKKYQMIIFILFAGIIWPLSFVAGIFCKIMDWIRDK